MLTFYLGGFIFTEIYKTKDSGNALLFLSGLFGYNGVKTLEWFKDILYNIVEVFLRRRNSK